MSMEQAARVTCPVCGQQTDPSVAPSITYQGRRYYFECQRCVQRFLFAPELFVGGQALAPDAVREAAEDATHADPQRDETRAGTGPG